MPAIQMKAVIQKAYGLPSEVLDLQEVDKPIARDDEILVHVHAASVHPDIWHVDQANLMYYG